MVNATQVMAALLLGLLAQVGWDLDRQRLLKKITVPTPTYWGLV
jgi:hypothetical protein